MNPEFVSAINEAQSLWKAKIYERFDGIENEDMIKMHGGRG